MDRMSKYTETRRQTLKKLAASAGGVLGGALASVSGFPLASRYVQANISAPIKIGFPVHRTGIGSTYGRWYERVTRAAVKLINDSGGINGRFVEIIAEDDQTDPRRGSELMDKFAVFHQCDIVFGTLFNHVVIASAARAHELKMPYFVVSEGHHVASGALNRYLFQPGITDVKSQIQAIAPYIADNLGKNVSTIFPDYSYGYDHRDFFRTAIKRHGGHVIDEIAIPPTETSFTKYFPKISKKTEVIYHVMVGPSVLTFVRDMGEFFASHQPTLFGFIDSLEAVDLASPGLDFLEGSYFWEGYPRYAQQSSSEQRNSSEYDRFYRKAIGVDANGAAIEDHRDISAYSHMFGCWETLYVIKAGMEAINYRSRADHAKLIEAIESLTRWPHSREYPQGDKLFNGKTHQVFGHQYISRLQNGKLNVIFKSSIDDSLYPDATDYTQQPL